jgi:hypothetical protein
MAGAPGCSGENRVAPSDSQDHNVSFSVHIALNPETTNVLADGVVQPLATDNTGFPVVVFTRMFPNYSDAAISSPFTFEFYAGTTLVNVGHSVPGECARFCSAPPCPPTHEVTEEVIDVSQGDFVAYQYRCLMCNSPKVLAGGCI